MFKNICKYDYVEFVGIRVQALRGTQLEFEIGALKVAFCIRDVRLVKIDAEHVVPRSTQKPRYCISAATADVQYLQRAVRMLSPNSLNAIQE